MVEKQTGSGRIEDTVRHVYDGIRAEIAEAGFDPHKYILGMVLSHIRGDDGNCFVWSNLIDPKKHKDLFEKSATNSQDRFRTRLEGEVSAVEIPEHIRQQLQLELDSVNTGNWQDPEVFGQAFDRFRSVSKYVADLMEQEPQLQEAYDFHCEVSMRQYLEDQ